MTKARNAINRLLNNPSLLSEKFHEKTKIKKAKNMVPVVWPKEWKKIYFKSYPRLPEIKFPKPKLPSIPLKTALIKRESIRKFSKQEVEFSKISSLLFYSGGIRDKNSPFMSRFYPSSGARYPLEIYLISLNTQGLDFGLYHYYLKNHSLEQLLTFNSLDHKKYFLMDQKWIDKAPCIIAVTAVFKRNTNKYGIRGYRHIMAEAGSLIQNFYLLSAALDLSCCAFDGYLDDKLNQLLDIDGVGESVVSVLGVGGRP